MDHSQDEFLHVYGENYVIRVLVDDGVVAALGEQITWRKNASELTRGVGGVNWPRGSRAKHDNLVIGWRP